ncbi:hypothetical protein BH09PSE5_BH09PSE5_18840 [soil metagenome]
MSHRSGRHTERHGFAWSLWGVPILMAVVSVIGLLSALLGDGAWDAVSWVGLGIPLVVCVWYGWMRRGPKAGAKVAGKSRD